MPLSALWQTGRQVRGSNGNDDTSSEETNDETSDEPTDKPLSTEEIYKLYENRTDLEDSIDEQLSAKEIIKLIENYKNHEEVLTDANEDDHCTE